VPPAEALEQQRQIVGQNADTCILDHQFHGRPTLPHRHTHRTAGVGELEGIVQQIREHAGQLIRAAPDRRQRSRHIDGVVDVGLFCARGKDLRDRANHGQQIDRRQGGRRLSFDARQLQQIVRQPLHPNHLLVSTV